MLLLRLTFLGVVATVSVNGTFDKDMDEAKMNELYNCFYAILCDARKPQEFRRIMIKADSETIQLGFGWLKDITNITGSDTPEFWESYPDKKCHLSDKKKQDYFMEYMKTLGEHWAKTCAEVQSEKCVKMGEAENEYNKVMAEYTANGVCLARAINMTQGKIEEGKEAMGKGIEGGKDVMEGFGKKGRGFGK